MSIKTYEQLTGITVPESQAPLIQAQIRRVQAYLESSLGYTLNQNKATVNQYQEKGKTVRDCACNGDFGELLSPDDVVGAYRLFSFRKSDKYFTVDPFTKIHKVKLVYVGPGEGDTGVTIKTFDDGDIRIQKRGSVSKYVENCERCMCYCGCDDCVQLAVDADWLFDGCLPDDLLYIWTDAVTYEADCKKDVRSETLGSHSYTKFDRESPLMLATTQSILQRYSGPNGTFNKTIV